MTRRLELPKFQAFDSNGDPLSGGKVYTYEAGTSTLKTSYSDFDASTPNANPVILDSRGEADIYVNGAYKITVHTSGDVLVWTLDNVQGGVGADAIGGDFYYPDATAADQGATGNSDTIKYAVDTISTDTGTIYLKHDSGSATTTYTVTTSETIPKNITLIKEPGVILDGAGTLTINGPFEAGLEKAFGNTITIIFGLGSVRAVLPEWSIQSGTGTSGDPYVIDFAQVDAAAVNVQTVELAYQTYYQIESPPWTMTNTINLFGRGIISNAGTSAETALYCPTDNWRYFRDVKIIGNAASGIGIHLFKNLRWSFDNVYIYGSGTTGLKIEGSYIGTVTGGAVKESGADGIMIIDEPGASYPSNALSFLGVLVENNTDSNYIMSLDTNAQVSINIIGGVVENGGTGITIDAGSATMVNIKGVYFEGFDTDNAILADCDSLKIEDIRLVGADAVVKLTAGRNIVIDGVENYGAGEKIVFSANDAIVKNMFLDTNSLYDCPRVTEEALSNRGIQGTGNLLRNGNLIPRNASDTAAPPHWSLFQTPTLAVDDAPTKASGSSIKVTGTGTTYEGIYQTVDVEIPANEEKLYTISALVKCTAGDTARIAVRKVGNEHGIILSNTAWERHSFQVKAMSGETTLMVNLTAVGDGDIVWFSEVQLVESNDIKGWLHHPLDYPDASTEVLTAGASTLGAYLDTATLDSSGGAITGTLGDGYRIGQLKTIVMTDATTSSTVSITHHQTSDPEVATFDAVDETGVFMWTGTEWITVFATCTFV